MNTDQDITRLLDAAGRGESGATEQLIPLVYDQLRLLAARKLGRGDGQTMQPTALVHEVFLRLSKDDPRWSGRRHFFAAAAIAMRRILVDRARARDSLKRGGDLRRQPMEFAEQTPAVQDADAVDWIALDSAMNALLTHDGELAELVHLRFYAGLTVDETAAALGKSPRTVNRDWLIARAWLLRHMETADA